MREWIKRLMTAVLAFSMLSVTCIGALAQPAAAFNAFGFDVGMDGIHKAEQARDTAPREQDATPEERSSQRDVRDTRHDAERGLNRAAEKASENASQGLERARERADVHAMVRFANNDTYTRTALKDFDGDRFCVKTEERVAYAQVLDDGSVELLNQEPDDCYEVSTSEEFVAQAWDKTQSGNPPTEKEFKENVDMPWGLKWKVFRNNMFS